MVYFEKSQPAPSSLEKEKKKKKGDYSTPEVLNRLKCDFKNKCYICELKEPTSINVEHFRPHRGDKDLMFDWNNLFYSCSHCNNTKLAQYDNILNCTNKADDIENKLKYIFNPFPAESVQIEALDTSPETKATKELLLAVYNGTTKLKLIESSNLRNCLLNEIMDFQNLLCDYFKSTNYSEEKEYFLEKIQKNINRASGFTAFKRGIIKENKQLKEEFEKYFD
jgi:uncharacterized protein (TIGR02646 family)